MSWMGNLTGFFEWALGSFVYDPGEPLFLTSPFFLLFFLLFLAVLIPFSGSPRGRTAVILVFSFWFYYKCSGLYVLLLVASGAVNFLLGMAMERSRGNRAKNGLLYAGVLLNLSVLAAFKYTPAASALPGWLGGSFTLAALAFPAGISFFTFVNLAYLLDVKKNRTGACRSLPRYLAFITFFPTVQMGPIERAGRFLPQLEAPFRLSRTDVAEGFYLVFSGALKKMVIGDFVNQHLVAQVFSMPDRHTGMEVFAAILGYSLVIYCDFSGYTDMGRGIARWMGFDIRINFDRPYRSRNIGEFWNRWHVSLSSWLRDYLFLPLAYRISGRVKREFLIGGRYIRTDLAIFGFSALFTFTVCGVWHGTGWNFLAWGAMHGVALGVQRAWSYHTKGIRRGRSGWGKRAGRVTGIALTFLFVSFAWVFFRTSSPAAAWEVFGQVWRNFYPEGFPLFLRAYYPVLLMMSAGYLVHFLPGTWHDRLRTSLVPMGWPLKALIAVAILAVITWFRSQGSPMPIYIQF